MSKIENKQWIWPNVNPTGSTGFTEFPSRLTHSYFVDLSSNSTWSGSFVDRKVLSVKSETIKKTLFVTLCLSFVINLIRIVYQIKKASEMDKNDTRIIRRWITMNSIAGNVMFFNICFENASRLAHSEPLYPRIGQGCNL